VSGLTITPYLVELALDMVCQVLKSKDSFIAKVMVRKPDSPRARSRGVYLVALPKGELLVKTSVSIQDLEFNDVFPAKFMRARAAPGHQRGPWRFPAILVHECA
jgi:hypothetical protein